MITPEEMNPDRAGELARYFCSHYNLHETHSYHPPSCECCNKLKLTFLQFAREYHQEKSKGLVEAVKALIRSIEPTIPNDQECLFCLGGWSENANEFCHTEDCEVCIAKLMVENFLTEHEKLMEEKGD